MDQTAYISPIAYYIYAILVNDDPQIIQISAESNGISRKRIVDSWNSCRDLSLKVYEYLLTNQISIEAILLKNVTGYVANSFFQDFYFESANYYGI